MRYRVPFVIAITCCAPFFVSPAFAADYTDLADAADDKDDLIDETYDGFDFNIEPSFVMDFGSAMITREAACVPRQSDLVGAASTDFEASNPRLEVNPERCSEPRVVDNNEAEYRRQTMTLNLALKAGLYKDLELRLNIPYVLNDVQGLKYAENVDASNSSIDPSQDRVRNDAQSAFNDADDTYEPTQFDDMEHFSTYRFFNLEDEFTDYSRSGFGDPSLGIHWAPFNDYRDDTKATLAIGMDWLMPLAPLKKADNQSVGGGLHELTWTVSSSKRFDFIEPYFGLEYTLPLPAPNSPIRQLDTGNDGQVFIVPPQRGEITIGTEFIPHENEEDGSRYGVDLQFRFGYTSEGRDYTPLWEAMSQSACNGQTAGQVTPDGGSLEGYDGTECAWIAQQPGNAPYFGGNPNPIYDLDNAQDSDAFGNYDGIMTAESYGSWAGRLGFILQPNHNFALKAHVQLKHQQEHMLTNARTGRDVPNEDEVTPDDTVDLQGPDAELEKNPVFNPTFDGNGRRFRVQEYNTWTIFLTAALKF